MIPFFSGLEQLDFQPAPIRSGLLPQLGQFFLQLLDQAFAAV